MIILGIDPGTATSGYGVVKVLNEVNSIEDSNGNFEVWKYGLIETKKEIDPGKRLNIIHRELDYLLNKYNPDVMAIERLFFATNAKTAMQVGQACGVMMFTASRRNVPVKEYAPGTIKKIITGNGRANKKDIQEYLRVHLGSKIKSAPKKKTHFDNAADALAVALCHAIKSPDLIINTSSEIFIPKIL